MAFEKTRINEYYALRKETFSVDPVNDSKAYFGNARLSDRIRGRIEGDFAQARGVPKFYILGDYGTGKTHTLFHIAYELENNQLESVLPVYVDIAPLKKKEKFSTLQGRLLDAIGLDQIGAAVDAFITNVKGDKATGIQEILRYGDAALKSSQSNVFRTILLGGRQRQLSWEWLKGGVLAPGDRESLQVTKTLNQPGDFIHVLLNTAIIYRAGTGKKIVYLLDEVEAVRDVTDPDSEAELIFAFRELLDDSNNVLGIIAAIQPEGDDIGTVMSNFAIMRRIGKDTGVFDLTSLVRDPVDLQQFVDDLLCYLINQDRAAQIVAEENLNCLPHHFPFTEEALSVLKDGLQSVVELQRPAGIIQMLATAAIEAWRKRTQSESRVLVNAQTMEEVLYPGR